ncbi:hypothetical protein MSAN_01754100 [Mycena sanguinolenta]|uniref:Uncharacterized protein n=1 Tax=Mycena sanguinolenta TaxID=230812 RepID=A0A8H6XVN8_9AGAR|nr:hypothetical protein MSAN_01754100 [Mycena sanguinolenta]
MAWLINSPWIIGAQDIDILMIFPALAMSHKSDLERGQKQIRSMLARCRAGRRGGWRQRARVAHGCPCFAISPFVWPHTLSSSSLIWDTVRLVPPPLAYPRLQQGHAAGRALAAALQNQDPQEHRKRRHSFVFGLVVDLFRSFTKTRPVVNDTCTLK